MRTLYVVTHAEATHHLEDLVGGWFDSSLTEAGAGHAAAIAEALRARIPASAPVDIWSSDLARAAQTAAPVADLLGADVRSLPGLREKSYGQAEGRPQAWFDARFVPPPAFGVGTDAERLAQHEGLDGAETKRAFVERVYAAVEHVLTSPTEHQVLVTHGFALTFVIACWIRMPLEAAGWVSFPVPSGSITTLREDDVFHNRSVVTLGEVIAP